MCDESWIENRNVSALAWSPDNSFLAVARDDTDYESCIWNAKLQLFEVMTGETMFTFPNGRTMISSLAWHPSGKELVSEFGRGVLQRWDMENGKIIASYKVSDMPITWLSWNPAGTRLAVGGWDNIIRILNEMGKVVKTRDFGTSALPGLSSGIGWLAWCPNPNFNKLATCAVDGTIHIWDSDTLELISKFKAQPHQAVAGAWSPGGTRIATGSQDNTARIWNAATGKLLFTLRGHHKRINGVSWHPTGRLLATASSDNTIRLWNSTNGKEVHVIEAQLTADLWHVTWSVDWRLAFAGEVYLGHSEGKHNEDLPLVEVTEVIAPTGINAQIKVRLVPISSNNPLHRHSE